MLPPVELHHPIQTLREYWLALIYLDREKVDKYIAYSLVALFFAYFILQKSPHRIFFYFVCLPAMIFYLRPSVFAELAKSWCWRLSMFLCLVWMVSTAWSQGVTAESVYDGIRIALLLGVFLTASMSVARRGRLPEQTLWLGLVAVAGATAVIVLALSPLPAFSYGGRLIGFGWASHSGIGGDLYAFAALVAIVLAAETKARMQTAVLLLAAGICCVYVVMTESRGSVLAFIVAVVAFGAVRRPGYAATLLLFTTAGAALLQLVGIIDLANWVARGNADRFAIWGDALSAILAHPFVGVGSAHVVNVAEHNSVHNVFIAMQYYLGLLGSVPFLALCLLIFIRSWRLARGGEPLYFVLLVFAFVTMSVHTQSIVINLSREWVIFWLLVILVDSRYHLHGWDTGASMGRQRQRADA